MSGVVEMAGFELEVFKFELHRFTMKLTVPGNKSSKLHFKTKKLAYTIIKFAFIKKYKYIITSMTLFLPNDTNFEARI